MKIGSVLVLQAEDDVGFDAAYQTGQLNLKDGPGERGLSGAHKLPFSLSYEQPRCALLLAVDSRRGQLQYGTRKLWSGWTIWVVGSNTVLRSRFSVLTQRASTSHMFVRHLLAP